jgi:peptidoglycan-associated lipoprotein
MLLLVALVGALLVMGCGKSGQFPQAPVLNETVHFDLGKYNLRPEATRILDYKISYMKHFPGHIIFVVGNADYRNNDEFNLILAAHRAAEVQRYLVNNGINPKRIFLMSEGKRQPAAQGTSDSATFENRRAEFFIIATGSLQ